MTSNRSGLYSVLETIPGSWSGVDVNVLAQATGNRKIKNGLHISIQCVTHPFVILHLGKRHGATLLDLDPLTHI